jgi:hypothetical protein
MIDVSILRRPSEDRVRNIPMYGGEASVDVLYCGREEMNRIRQTAADLIKGGMTSEDAHNAAWGRVALIGFTGFCDEGVVLKVSDEARDLLMLGSSEVRTTVIQGASSLKANTEKN